MKPGNALSLALRPADESIKSLNLYSSPLGKDCESGVTTKGCDSMGVDGGCAIPTLANNVAVQRLAVHRM